MQGRIVTSRFSSFGEPRGALVVKRRSDGFAQCSPRPSRETLPRTGSLLRVGPATSRTNGASTGLQEAVRLGLGNEKSAPPDDDWWAHQKLSRPPESAGLPSTLTIAGEFRVASVSLYQLIENKDIKSGKAL
jgi:hypothetical protein